MNLPAQKKDEPNIKSVPVFGVFGFSVLIHVGLLVFIGGVVLTESVVPKIAFKGELAPMDTEVKEEPAGDEPLESPSDSLSNPIDTPMEASTAKETTEMMDVVKVESAIPTQTFFAPSSAVSSTPGMGSPSSGSSSGKSSRPGPKGPLKMTSLFGTAEDTGVGLAGFLYDLKQTKGKRETTMNFETYRKEIADFATDWNPNRLKEYYHSKNPLFIAQIMIPKMDAKEAPKAFGVEKEVQPRLWFAHYTGKVKAPKSGTYRFVGRADDILLVAVNKRTVLDGSLSPIITGKPIDPWFEMKNGEEVTIDLVIGEQPGGWFYASLGIQSKKDADDKLPVLGVQFTQSEMPEQKDMIITFPKKPFVFEAPDPVAAP